MAPKVPRILIVDDEVDSCENLRDIFIDFGYQVDIAHDGYAALRLIEEHAYDVALLDLRMPGMNGLELYNRIKQRSAGTVALVVTAYASSDTAQSVLAAGAWRIVPKPVDIQHLVGLVEEAIDNPLVLVVDDDSDLCENLWELLREEGYRVHWAHNADEAESVLKRHVFQVVLLDMKLPGQDGLDVLELIQQTNCSARTVMITGFRAEMESRVQQALAAGANAICYKPFDVPSLLATLKKAIQDQS